MFFSFIFVKFFLLQKKEWKMEKLEFEKTKKNVKIKIENISKTT